MSNDEDISSHNRAHYDSVTDAWAYVLGSNLHYGLFYAAPPGLDAATDRLVWEMAALARVPGAAGNCVLFPSEFRFVSCVRHCSCGVVVHSPEVVRFGPARCALLRRPGELRSRPLVPSVWQNSHESWKCLRWSR